MLLQVSVWEQEKWSGAGQGRAEGPAYFLIWQEVASMLVQSTPELRMGHSWWLPRHCGAARRLPCFMATWLPLPIYAKC